MVYRFPDNDSDSLSDLESGSDPYLFWMTRGPRNEEEFRMMPRSMRVWGTAFEDFPEDNPEIPVDFRDERGDYNTMLRARRTGVPTVTPEGDEENEGEPLFLHRAAVLHPNVYEWYRPPTFNPTDPPNGPNVGYADDSWMANMHHVAALADPSLDAYFGDAVANVRPANPFEDLPRFPYPGRRFDDQVARDWLPRRWQNWTRYEDSEDENDLRPLFDYDDLPNF